jgi:hypothetical protein
MYRRDFVKLSSLAGLSVFLPGTLATSAGAQEAGTWDGPYFLHMHASGGWDPTLFCDGKTTASGSTPEYQNRVVTGVENVGPDGFKIPVPTQTAEGDYYLRVNQGADIIEHPLDFFTRQNLGGNRFLVFNGVDTQTNNHETGVQGLACGHNDVELPALAALFAGAAAQQKNIPLAFLAHGQYNRTGDVVGVSRFPGDKVGLLAEPFRASSGDEKLLVSDVAAQRIAQLREQRLALLQKEVSLPRNKRTLQAMIDASKGGTTLTLLKELAGEEGPSFDSMRPFLADATVDYLAQEQNGTSRFQQLGGPLEVLLRCFAKGVSAGATFAQGGFDTHDNHDVNQQNAMGAFVARLRYVLVRAQQLGIIDKLYVLVTSDFGRTPKYNTGNGKDHWNVTSAMLMGPGITGGRAIGRTDEGQKAMRVAKGDVSQVLPQDDRDGARIFPAHVHAALRSAIGVDKAAFISGFPLPTIENKLDLRLAG